jgi:hypothetical protein
MQIGAGLIFHFHQIVTKHSLYYPLFPTLFWTKSTCYRNLEYNYNKSWVEFGQGKQASDLVEDREVQFTVNSPNNVPGERRMTEIFHLETMYSFNEGS